METRSHKVLPHLERRATPEPETPVPKDETSSDSTYGSVEGRRIDPDAPQTRRRRARSSQSMDPASMRSAKRLNGSAQKGFVGLGPDEGAISVTPGNRAFPCPLAVYGCNSTFGSKNEWKRHVNTQHMRLGFWRCDQCPSDGNRGPNDFNRKDLFIQHIRRMHSGSFRRSSTTKPGKDDAEEQALQEIAARCYRHIRSPPEQSSCIFCDQQFHGIGSWDDRMEHVGRHMEVAKREAANIAGPLEWRSDPSTHTWMANELIIAPHGDQWVLQDLDAQAWPGNPQPAAGNVPPPGPPRTPRQSIPGKRSSSYHYVPLREAHHMPHGAPGEHQSIAPSPIAPSPSVQQFPSHQQIQPQPRDAEPHGIGLVSGPNGMAPYVQESEDERPQKRIDRHSPNGMVPPERQSIDCEWQECQRRGVYGFATVEDMDQHIRDVHRPLQRSEAYQTVSQGYTQSHLPQPEAKRPMNQEEAYRAHEAERQRLAQQPWGYGAPNQQHLVPQAMVNGYTQAGMHRLQPVPDQVRTMPPMSNGHMHSVPQSAVEETARRGEAVVISDNRADVEVHEQVGPAYPHHDSRTIQATEQERDHEREREHEHEDDLEHEYERLHDDDREHDQQSPVHEETRVIGRFPRWRDEYGFKYCSSQDLTENDIYELRERSQDLEMVLANVWQALVRTGGHESHPYSALALLVRRFAPNVLVTAAQPGGLAPYNVQPPQQQPQSHPQPQPQPHPQAVQHQQYQHMQQLQPN